MNENITLKRIQKPQRSLHPNMCKLSYTFTYMNMSKCTWQHFVEGGRKCAHFHEKMYYKLVKAVTS